MIFVFVGSIKIALTPRFGNKSVFVDQLRPSSVDFHNPPAGDPAKSVLTCDGCRAITLILPIPFKEFPLVGPTRVQFPNPEEIESDEVVSEPL